MRSNRNKKLNNKQFAFFIKVIHYKMGSITSYFSQNEPKIAKQFVSPNALRDDSYLLASKVIEDGFHPDFIVAIWRGGAFIGMCVHEFFKYFGFKVDHIAIRTSRYTGVDETAPTVEVYNLGYLASKAMATSKILLIDDVHDEGYSIEAVFNALKERMGDDCPTDIRVGTIDYKPSRNKTGRIPHYYIYKRFGWMVYPHELEKLTIEEIRESKGDNAAELIIKMAAFLGIPIVHDDD